MFRPGIADDCGTMLSIESLLKELGAALPAAGEHHPQRMQFVVGGGDGIADLQLGEDVT